MKQVLKNRRRLKPIIRTIIFLCWQNILLKRYSDLEIFYQKVNSVLSILNADSIGNTDNFREFLKLRI